MYPGIVRGRQGKNLGRNHERDPKRNPVIDLEIGPDPAIGKRTVEEGLDPESMMKVGGSTESPEVEMKMKTKVTTIGGPRNGTPASTTKGQPSKDLLRPKKNTAIVNRNVFLTMSDRPRFLKWNTNQLIQEEENSIVTNILRQPQVIHYFRTMTCGMTILSQQNNRSHRRVNSLNMFLPLRRHLPRAKLLLHRLPSLLNPVIRQVIIANKPLNLLINLHHHQ